MPVLKVEYCSSLTGELIEKLRCASIFTVASFVAADLEQISFRIKVSYKVDIILLDNHGCSYVTNIFIW